MDSGKTDCGEEYKREKVSYEGIEHKPVLLRQVMENLKIKPDGVYIDATLGGAGHASEILKKLGEGGMLIGIDQDEQALVTAAERLSRIGTKGQFQTAKANFENIEEICRKLGHDKADGILMDLGVSSFQLDSEERGFSYRFDSPIDMRMDRESELTGKDVVNGYTEEELTRIIREYGEERYAREIARKIAEARRIRPIETTGELTELILQAIPEASRRKEKGHPAKRTFQAVRIEVNRELEVLEKGLCSGIDMLRPGGRLLVITFHSLETRICREVFRKKEKPCTCPKDFPVCVCGKVPEGKTVGKGIFPEEKEKEENPRSSCASLRIFEKF